MSHAAVADPPVALPGTHAAARLPVMAGSVMALLGLVGSAVLYSRSPTQFYASWMVAFIYFLTIALGCLYFVLIHSATQSGWGVVVRRLGETAAATLPLFALLFLPVVLGMSELFPWARAEAASDHLIQWKKPYLNNGFFFIRAAIYFLVWTGLAVWAYKNSTRQDAAADLGLANKVRRFSGPLLIPLALTQTFASFDWLMSLDPHWYSTIFGVYVFSGAFMAAFAFLVLVCVTLQGSGLMRTAITTEHYHDLGKLLFAFTVFWAYIGFCQFFLIWYGNIPEETLWYKHRLHHSWAAVSLLLAVGHFGIPFFFLMSRHMKRNKKTLAIGAAWLLLMHLVDIHWMVMPSFHEEGVSLSLLDFTTLLAVGGAFLATFGMLLRRHPLLPVGDPRLAESLRFENTF